LEAGAPTVVGSGELPAGVRTDAEHEADPGGNMAVNKNNRRVLSKPAGAYTEAGQLSRFIPLDGGYCYMRDPRNGKAFHVKVNSERFDTLLDEFVATIGKERLVSEIEGLTRKHPGDGWDKALRRLRNA